jgi:hypothetical protein
LLRTLTDYPAPPREYVKLGLILISASVAVFAFLVTALYRRAQRAARQAVDPDYLETREFEILDEGMKIVTPREHSLLCWSGITGLTDDGAFIYVHRAPGSAYYLPLSAFPGLNEYKAFLSALRERVGSRA